MTPDQPVPAHCPNCSSGEFTIEVPLGIWVCNDCGYTTSGLPDQPESSEKVPNESWPDQCVHGIALHLRCKDCETKDWSRPCTCHPSEAPKPCQRQLAMIECEQRQRDIEQKAWELVLRGNRIEFAFAETDKFFAELDKRRAG